MQFKSSHWLSHHGLWANIPCSTNMVNISVIFRTSFYVSLVSYSVYFRAFLIKLLFHSRLLDMRWFHPTRGDAPRWLSISSYPTRARGKIIVKCIILSLDKGIKLSAYIPYICYSFSLHWIIGASCSLLINNNNVNSNQHVKKWEENITI